MEPERDRKPAERSGSSSSAEWTLRLCQRDCDKPENTCTDCSTLPRGAHHGTQKASLETHHLLWTSLTCMCFFLRKRHRFWLFLAALRLSWFCPHIFCATHCFATLVLITFSAWLSSLLFTSLLKTCVKLSNHFIGSSHFTFGSRFTAEHEPPWDEHHSNVLLFYLHRDAT